MAKSILLIDDNSAICQVLGMALRQSGYDVRTFTYGKEARTFIEERGEYDIAFIDRNLGERMIVDNINGDLLMELSKEVNPNVPVVSIGIYVDKPRFCNDALTKPITPSDLCAVIERFTGRVD